MCPDQASQTMPSATPSGACCSRRAWPDVQGIGVGATVQAQQVVLPSAAGGVEPRLLGSTTPLASALVFFEPFGPVHGRSQETDAR
jgi:hypothetical protein